jgi:Fe2+ or Zn2+ uptake regulation protein
LDEADKAERLERFRSLCNENGIPFTIQRRVILETVLDLDTHPTADEIHGMVSRSHPGISRATVYRSLEELSRRGMITKACHPGKAVRYDARTESHHHLVCLYCDSMIDISDARLDAVPLPDTSEQDFEIIDIRVQLRGVCRKCQKKEATP